jgi:glycerophosphoryl diester phosphodiesterase
MTSAARVVLLPILFVFSLLAFGCAKATSEPSIEEPQHQAIPPQQEKPPVHFEEPEFGIQGHRGARAIYPENTLTAFEYAVSVGATHIEFDTQYTNQNEIVINHDPYISGKRCLTHSGQSIPDKKIYIHTLSVAQIKQYDCGSLREKGMPKYLVPGSQIPTLDELIEQTLQSQTLNAHKVIFKFDIKSDPTIQKYFPEPSEIARLILDKVYKYGIEGRSEFSAFDPRVLKELYKLNPNLRMAFLVGISVGKKVLDLAQTLHVKIFSPHYLGLYISGINKWTKNFQSRSIDVVPYTVNSKKAWKKFLDAGVKGILTDDPEGLKAFYKAYKHSNTLDVEDSIEEFENGPPEEEFTGLWM